MQAGASVLRAVQGSQCPELGTLPAPTLGGGTEPVSRSNCRQQKPALVATALPHAAVPPAVCSSQPFIPAQHFVTAGPVRTGQRLCFGGRCSQEVSGLGRVQGRGQPPARLTQTPQCGREGSKGGWFETEQCQGQGTPCLGSPEECRNWRSAVPGLRKTPHCETAESCCHVVLDRLKLITELALPAVLTYHLSYLLLPGRNGRSW